MLRICCFKLRAEAILPAKSKDPLDAGHDIFTPIVLCLQAGERATVNTGLVIWYEPLIVLPEGLSWYPRLAPKSGLASKSGLDVLAGVGDRGYCGPEDEMKVVLLNTGSREIVFGAGSAICQIIPEVVWRCENMTADEQPVAPKQSSRGGLGSGSDA
jgi:dUTP pyrophosphatase